jgi:prepilin peptidase CpaA
VALPIEIVLAAIVLIAALFDLRYRKIPNWLALTGLLSGIFLNTYLQQWIGLRTSLLGIGVALLVYLPFYLLRAMGGGDVKLMMAVGALVGPAAWVGIFVITSILGGVIAILLLLFRGRLRKTLWNVWFILQRLARFEAPYAANPELDVNSEKSVKLPHGAVIALGVLVYLAIV